MKLPLALLLGRTEHGAVSTSHGSTQLLDQVPLGEDNTGFIFSFTVKFIHSFILGVEVKVGRSIQLVT